MTVVVPPIPTPVPLRSDPINFPARGDAVMGALPGVIDAQNQQNAENNAINQNVNLKSQAADNAASAAAASATAAAASAASAVNSPATSATSATSLTLGTGTRTLTIQADKAFSIGQPVMIARTSAPATAWMAGNITAYNAATGALTVNASLVNGAGTFADWTVSLAGPVVLSAQTVPEIAVTGLLDSRATVVLVAASTTALKSRVYVFTAAATLTLPASPSAGDWVGFSNRSGSSSCVIARNGQNIMGLAENMTIDNVNHFGTLVYADVSRGWIFQ